jgi:hypothetical protein
VAERLGVRLIPGVEITCEAAGTEVHLLGLGIDLANSELRALCETMQARRHERFAKMHLQLEAAGVRFELPRMPEGMSLARPAMARLLVERGFAPDMEEAFARFLRKGCPGFVPHRRESVQRAIEAVHAAGGVAVLAHPGIYRNSEECIEDAAGSGVDGIECWHPDHDEARTRKLEQLARRRGWLLSGGADYHGPGHARSHWFGKKLCPPNEAHRIVAAATRSSRHEL